MRSSRIFLAVLLSLALSFTLTACGGGGGGGGGGGKGGGPVTPPVSATLLGITVTPATATVDVGQTQQFTATGAYDDGKDYNITADVTWTSDDTLCAQVSSSGLATAQSPGTATITATLDAISGSAGLTVPLPNILPGASEGTLSAPVAINVDVEHTSAIGPFKTSYYYFQTSDPGSYLISLTGLQADLKWEVYPDAAFSNRIDRCDDNWYAADEHCLTDLDPSGYYYLKVTDKNVYDSTDFTLLVKNIKSEGSPGSPIALTTDTVYSGMVNGSSSSFYSFTPTATSAYTFTFSNVTSYYTSQQLTLDIYDTSFGGTLLLSCPRNGLSFSCTVNDLMAGSTYYVETTRTEASDLIYDIAISNGISEGSQTNPISLTVGTPHAGAVDGSGASYYTFTVPSNAQPGSYVVTLDTSTPMQTYIYDDFNSTALEYCNGRNVCSADGLTPGATYYVKVQSQDYYTDATYNITVAAGGSEGSMSSPVDLQLDQSHQGNIDAYSTSYYHLVADTSGLYNIALANVSGGSNTYLLQWYLYSDSGFTTQIGECNYDSFTMQVNPICGYTLDPGDYYLKVISTDTSGVYNVIPSHGLSEGSDTDPRQLTLGVKHNGAVAARDTSYYTFTTTTAGDYNLIINATSSVELWAYNSSFTGVNLGHCNQTSGSCTISGLSANTAYGIEVQEWNGLDVTFALTVDYQDPLGCTPYALECYDFEDGLFPSNFVNSSASSTLGWVVDNTFTHGSYSIRSGAIIKNETSCFDYTPAVNTAYISFNVYTSSASGDYLRFYIDNTLQQSWSGTSAVDWSRVSFTPYTGSHTYTWCYVKDPNTDAGADAVWVDDIEVQ